MKEKSKKLNKTTENPKEKVEHDANPGTQGRKGCAAPRVNNTKSRIHKGSFELKRKNCDLVYKFGNSSLN